MDQDNWTYKGEVVDEDVVNTYKSFVYLITNTSTNRKYYGKKRITKVLRKKVKNKIRRKKVVSVSDWLNYWGSSEFLLQDIEKYGKQSFTREILRYCNSYGEASYYEAKYQLEHDVLLFPQEYYNSFVGMRVHRKHLKGLVHDE